MARRRPTPSLLFRLAVVVAGVALVAGIGGAARLMGQQPPHPPPGLTRITIRGMTDDPLKQIEVMWWTDGALAVESARRTEDPEAWLAGPLPTGQQVWVRLVDVTTLPSREIRRWRTSPVAGEGLLLQLDPAPGR